MGELEVEMPAGLQEAAITVTSHPSVLNSSTSGAVSPQVRPTTIPSFDNSSQSSTTSQHSLQDILGLSTSDVAPTAVTTSKTADLTPPSSAASPTNDEQLTPRHPPSNKPRSAPSASGRSSNKSSASPAPPSRSENGAGNKRTASGQVKALKREDSGLSSGSEKSAIGHARGSSTLSTGSNTSGNVTEMSHQLRTKLKYAMVKVQNGWQSRSLDELESLASASPRSTTSTFQHVTDPKMFVSPRHAMRTQPMRTWSSSSSSESGHSDFLQALSPGPGLSGVNGGRGDGSTSKALAPPVNIVAGNRRRPSPNDAHIKHSNTKSQDLRRSLRPPTNQRTPSQTAASEADAVETLLFMASPNNSGYHPSLQASQESSLRSTQQWSAQTSPLRTQFSQASVTSPKKVAFSDQSSQNIPLSQSALIDRMLDDLPDESESDEGANAANLRSISG